MFKKPSAKLLRWFLIHGTNKGIVQDVQNGRTIGWLQWWNIAGSLYKEEEAAQKDD